MGGKGWAAVETRDPLPWPLKIDVCVQFLSVNWHTQAYQPSEAAGCAALSQFGKTP